MFDGPTKMAERKQQRHISSGARINLIEKRLREHYPQAQYVFVQFLTEHLSECSRTFDGDMIEMLVLAILGQAALQGLSAGGTFKAVNATRISDLIGIPRQTVRRKLLKLEERGWIVQDTDASWKLTQMSGKSPVQVALKQLDNNGIRRLAELYVGVAAICEVP